MKDQSVKQKFKIIIIGEIATGKTSLINRYCMNTFQTQYLATIGASFLEKEIKIDDKEITFQFWDTAGAEKFRTLTKLFYKGSSCCLVLYDITLRRTFDKVEAWTHEFR